MADDYLMSFDASGPYDVRPLDTECLAGPEVDGNSSSSLCLAFWFYMSSPDYADGLGQLNVS